MKKVIKENQKFIRIEATREEAKEKLKQWSDHYKFGRLMIFLKVKRSAFIKMVISLTSVGPHVNYTKKIKAFKLLSIVMPTIVGMKTTHNFNASMEPHSLQPKNLQNI